MNLLWHIVRKDARRIALPVVVWIALPVVATIWLRCSSWSGDTRDLAGPVSWIGVVSTLTSLASMIFFAGGVALAGYLVLEDRVVGSDSFWQTRPISGWRLLSAKSTSAFILLVAAPTVALLPVWAVGGFSPHEIFHAASLTAMLQAGLVVGALALASLAENLGEHAFAALVSGLLGLAAFFSLPETWLAGVGSPEVARLRDTLAALVAFPALAWVAWYQYVTRRCWPWPAVLVLMTMAIVSVRVIWRWELGKAWPVEATVVRTEGLALPALGLQMQRSEPEVVQVDAGARLADGSMLVPWSGEGELHWADGRRVEVWLEQAADWGQRVALHEVRSTEAGATGRWPMAVRFDKKVVTLPDLTGAEFSGRIRLMRMRARVVAELPLRRDAEWKDGVRRLRVIGGTNESPGSVLIEEREARPAEKSLRSSDGAWQDFFVMMNRPLGIAEALRIREVGSANLHGIVTGLRVVAMDALPRDAGWREGATIIKVRFESEARFERTLTGVAVQQTSGEAKP